MYWVWIPVPSNYEVAPFVLSLKILSEGSSQVLTSQTILLPRLPSAGIVRRSDLLVAYLLLGYPC